ncbi:CAF17-like 4Fe-4S cluster assembly/insertion protein YgfZ [Schumannella soli]|uniref:Folate-binding protein YgfZ n=1 Tax=Schumannella soli TaxID=2590779 RepID=A0A506Y3G8_9MICO|nr:folate-binding protein YgfZ [Schumannella soli]TPW75528.1 folate-binding protein YgfZ [Schumannella soli]
MTDADPFTSRSGAVGAPPQHYGNPIAEQRPLRAGEAVVDLSDRAVLTVTGPDRLSWLDSLTSQSLKGLAPGESTETLLLDPSGRVEHAARIVDDGETAWLLLDSRESGAALASFLDRMRFMLRVEVADRSDEVATVGGFGADPLRGLGSPLAVWRDPWAEITRGGHQYAQGEHPAADWDYSETVIPRGALAELSDLAAAGTLALEALRIEVWRPRAATELDATTLPHELDWLRSAVHLSKGCYRGQETVAKVHNLGHPPRRLVMLHLDGSENVVVAAGDEVRAGEKIVGRVTAVAQHHELGPVALAVLKRSAPEGDVVVLAEEGEVAAAQEVIVPVDAGAVAEVPRLPRLGAVRR